ncbi:MAG: transketolase-like TK C-terminal-containing protein, partial [Bacteroidota bacterium]
ENKHAGGHCATKTIMGKGVVTEDGKQMAPNCDVHGKPLSKAGASYEKTIESLGGDPDKPFEIFPEVKEYYEKVLREKRKRAERKKEIQSEWEKSNPKGTHKFNEFMSGKVPEIDYSAVEQKAGAATRAASGKVLAHFADNIENMIVASADLSDSDKTNDFLNKTTAFKKGDFSGNFLQMGVSELTMAAVCNGIAAHGGIFVACGTFLVFSDYMKPAVRLSGLMELPVKYIWTHDAFRVGEDGPTHQPIEHEAQLRLLEQMKNHSGKNCILVLRPADSSETTIAWKMAMENNDTPSALLLSRQNIRELPGKNGASRYESAKEAEKGAYIIKDTDGQPDIILVANGSEVSTLLEGAEKLEKEKQLKTRIVSAISEGIFKEQSEHYQKQIIPDNVPVFGMTAGVPQTLVQMVGCKGKVFGVEHFGYSAPYNVLDEKFGFTADNVVKQVEEFLKTFK